MSILTKLHEKYKIGETIGSGGQAEVKLGVYLGNMNGNGLHTGDKVAIKIAKISQHNPRSLMDKEIKLLEHIVHSDPSRKLNVARLYEKIEDNNHVVLILELCSGGELFDDILDKGTYSEYLAAAALNTMARILSELQKLNIIHRDIKPENFVYSDKTNNRKLKLIDFGMACFTTDTHEIKSSAIGTPAYQAPEIICSHSEATFASDIWSLGVVLFIMLSGTFPFNPNSGDEKLKKQIQNGTFVFNPNEWKYISKNAKDIITKMLTVDPTKRITISEILLHPFLTEQQEKKPFESDYFTRLRSAKAFHEFRGAVLAMVTAKKWLKKSLNHTDDELFNKKHKKLHHKIHSANSSNNNTHHDHMNIDDEEEKYIDISVDDLRNLQIKFDLECRSKKCENFNVDFHTFATIVSSIKSCHIFCSLTFYNMFDKQRLELMNYKHFIACLASLRENIDDDWVSFCFRLFDENGDMKISRKEFCALCPYFIGLNDTAVNKRSDLASKIITIASPSATMRIPIPEVTNAINNVDNGITLDELGFELIDYDDDMKSKLHDTFNAVDKDGLGSINYNEFKDWMYTLHPKK